MTELSIIVPTFNEALNVAELIRRLELALAGLQWEIIFVDDESPDGTAEVVRDLGEGNASVRCIERVGRRGLSSACIEGILSSSATYVAVMDADLQHDEKILPQLLDAVQSGGADLAVGSRYVDGGGLGDWNDQRKKMSLVAVNVARAITGVEIADIMSGFFLARRETILPALKNASGIGFKILLDIALSAEQPLKIVEVPYQFRTRFAGESKLDYQVVWQYLLLLADKKIGHFVPVRFLSFAAVGAAGLLVHMVALTLGFKLFGLSFIGAQIIATLVAMTSNFFMNNVLTYADKKLRGTALIRGWITFCFACGLGALANVGIADYLFVQDVYWVGSAVVGVLVGAVWNYAVTAVYTWNA